MRVKKKIEKKQMDNIGDRYSIPYAILDVAKLNLNRFRRQSYRNDKK